jgi:hypothetical protein
MAYKKLGVPPILEEEEEEEEKNSHIRLYINSKTRIPPKTRNNYFCLWKKTDWSVLYFFLQNHQAQFVVGARGEYTRKIKCMGWVLGADCMLTTNKDHHCNHQNFGRKSQWHIPC